MSDLDERRKAAIEADKCFSKSTLKNEFRMKPSPAAQPVKFFDNGFGGEFGIYRIADCIPMKEKRPVTEKQIESGKKLAERSRLTSKKGRASITAQALLDADPLFIDTETTGTGSDDQVIEIAVIDVNGQVLLDTRLRPSVEIHPEAQNVHNISSDALVDAPTWPSIAPGLRSLLEGRQVVAFNSPFDSRLLQQTAIAFGDDYSDWNITEHCAMAIAAQAYGARNRHGSISLFEARMEARIHHQGPAHNAAADALTALAVVKSIAAYLLQPIADQEPDQEPGGLAM